MTHALTNPMAIDGGLMVVDCNPLQRQEELLDGGQMGDTQGGVLPFLVPGIIVAAKAAAPYVAGAVTAIVVGVVVAELTSDDGSNGCTCRPMSRRRN